MRTRWLFLTLLPWAAGCDLGMDLDGLGDAFSCSGCWSVGGGGSGGGSTPSGPNPAYDFVGTIRVVGVPVTGVDAFAFVTVFGERSARGCDYAPSSLPGLTTMCIYATGRTDLTGSYRLQIGGSDARDFAASLTRGKASVVAELREMDSFTIRALGQWQSKPLTGGPDTALVTLVTDFDFPGAN